MDIETIKKYGLNCFLLLIPVLTFNIFFIEKLPPAFQMDFFWKNIPSDIAISENILRGFVFVIPLFLTLEINKSIQKVGLGLYLAGIAIYILSWMILIILPESAWSQSVYGFMAPGYTPILWLCGIGLIGQSMTFRKIPYTYIVYIIASVAFVAAHSMHSYTVFTHARGSII